MEMTDNLQSCRELLHATKIIYLATNGLDGYPYIRAVENLRCAGRYPTLATFFEAYRNDFRIYVSTNTSSLKIEQINNNNAAAVYACRTENYFGFMLGGTMEIVTDKNIKYQIWQAGWERYYPEGKDDPDYTILKFNPEFIRGWNGNEKFEYSLVM